MEPLDLWCEKSLQEIETLVSTGELQKARQQLAALSHRTLPGNRYSKEIGDLYANLGCKAMAGRYWYLLENPTEEMLSARQEFEHSLGNNPGLIHQQFLPWGLPPHAKARLAELEKEAAELKKMYPSDSVPKEHLWRDRAVLVAGSLVAFGFAAIFFMGVVSLAEMLISLR
ncbi:MAG: DUF6584 family protein [Pirellulales bacterium]